MGYMAYVVLICRAYMSVGSSGWASYLRLLLVGGPHLEMPSGFITGLRWLVRVEGIGARG